MSTDTLVATPDREPFDIHAQPTWIALGIGCMRREHSTAVVTHVDRITDEMALVHGRIGDSRFEMCLTKDPDFGAGHELYFDSTLGAS
jgi:hypothetical protein